MNVLKLILFFTTFGAKSTQTLTIPTETTPYIVEDYENSSAIFISLDNLKMSSATSTSSPASVASIEDNSKHNSGSENEKVNNIFSYNNNTSDNSENKKYLTNVSTTPNPKDLLIPPADIDGNIKKINSSSSSSLSAAKLTDKSETSLDDPECPSLENADKLSQTQLISRLTHVCRYDRLERPMTYADNGTELPVEVFTRAHIYFMQNLEAHELQFKIHLLLQFRYVDPRLVFKKVAPNRKQPIMGEKALRDLIWVPHVFLSNEKSSEILGTAEKDILTSISPDGTVIISTRIRATLYCWMNLKKFPFDEQHCSTILESWMYNLSQLELHWEETKPLTVAPELHLTEYALLYIFTNETIVNANLSDLRHGAFAGNYSSLSFTVFFSRESGFYLMDYYIPSMMLVVISWVTFWLQADQSAPRITLGTSTLLTFITLASAQGKTLPKVSYIKASEIWFLGCTGFIFGSLVEFAFVNTIWRRKKNVELKKVNSKYILKSTLTPTPTRKEMGLQKSHSCTSLDGQMTATPSTPSFNNYLTVHSFPGKSNSAPLNNNNRCSSNSNLNNYDGNSIMINVETASNDGRDNDESKTGWTTMTPQEIAIWIDKRSRFLFPITFIIFNIFYWIFVYFV
uniref:pH-sensitive chloride channel 2 n=1 Tax=Corethrella appendiculata TaxID=1370023 RepID=U5EYU4_9DIPT